jgi:phenylpyruvate tautomerase
MPFLELITNVTLTRAQTEEVALSLSAFAAETLKKPESAFGINVRANEVLTFAGTWAPCMLPTSCTLLRFVNEDLRGNI